MPDLFLPRSRPWHLTTAAEGGLKSAPASRLRGAVPHQLSSYASSSLARFVCSWRTMTGKPEIMPDCGTNFRLADNTPTDEAWLPPLRYDGYIRKLLRSFYAQDPCCGSTLLSSNSCCAGDFNAEPGLYGHWIE